MSVFHCLICQEPLPESCDTAPFCSADCAMELEQWAFVYLITTQRLTTTEFEELLQIPLLRDWARQVVWCTSPQYYPPRQQFIVVEDYTLADVNYRQVHLGKTTIAALYNPSRAWAEIFWEMEIVPLNLKKHRKRNEFRLVQHPWLIAQLCRNPSAEVRRKIVENPRLPPERLIEFATDTALGVVMTVAWQSNTPPETLAQLAPHPFADVRRLVAQNPHTPPLALAELVTDTEYLVRSTVAQRADLSAAWLLTLAQDEQIVVRDALARNPHTPNEILQQLAQDSDERVRATVAHHPQLALEMLLQLAQDAASTVRYMAAQNENLPLEMLRRLAQDTDERVREVVASNENLPLEVLETLTHDIDAWVREVAKKQYQARKGAA